MIKNFMNITNGVNKNAILTTVAAILNSIDKLDIQAQLYDVFTAHGVIKMLSDEAKNGTCVLSQAFTDFMNTTKPEDCPSYFNTDVPCIMYLHYVCDCRASGIKPVDFGLWLLQLKSGAAYKWYNDSECSYYLTFERFAKTIGDYHYMARMHFNDFVTYIYMLRFEDYFNTIATVDMVCADCTKLFRERLAELEAKANAVNNDLITVARFLSIFDSDSTSSI
jgi:hypothetical protein